MMLDCCPEDDFFSGKDECICCWNGISAKPLLALNDRIQLEFVVCQVLSPVAPPAERILEHPPRG